MMLLLENVTVSQLKGTIKTRVMFVKIPHTFVRLFLCLVAHELKLSNEARDHLSGRADWVHHTR